MNSTVSNSIPALLRAEPSQLREWVDGRHRRWLSIVVIALGAGLFGGAMGSWRGMEQSLYTAIKLPLILILTATGNALLNAALAPLLGLNLSLRQSFDAILLSFAIAAAILSSFTPLVLFEVWNLPAMDHVGVDRGATFNLIQLTQVAGIAFAGIAATARLLRYLESCSGTRAVAIRVLVAWLLGNLLLGSQLTWVLRPFFGQPELPVEFLRPNAFESNFFETLLKGASYLRDH